MRVPGAVGETYPDVEKVGFRAEVVSDPKSMAKGLSGRDSISDDRAMLFVLDNLEEKNFWMKGMRFPLDIVVFDRERRIMLIRDNLQPCEVCPVIRIPSNAAYVLEIKAGLSEKYGIKKGDFFEFR